MSANLSNQQSILKEVYPQMAIPPQFMKGNQKPDPKKDAKKKKAAERLAMLKAKSKGQ